VFLLFFITYIIQRENFRNKKLILERKEQDDKERIYNLLSRSQQNYERVSLSEQKKNIPRVTRCNFKQIL